MKEACMYERGEKVIVEGHGGKRAVLVVWKDLGRGLTLSTEDGYRRLLAGDADAPQVGFPLRDVRQRVSTNPLTSEPQQPYVQSPRAAPGSASRP